MTHRISASARFFMISMLICVLGIGLFIGCDRAYATTKQDLDAAKAKYEQVQAKLDGIAAEYEAMSIKQSQTMDAIEGVNKDIKQTEADIAEKEAQLEEHTQQLRDFAVETYKNGDIDYLDVLLSSADFKEFVSNFYVVDKINDQKIQLIEKVRDAKAALDEQRQTLEDQKSSLEELKAEQDEQLAEMQAKQDETAELLAGLDKEVAELTDKYNKELAARAAAEAAAKKAALEAAKSYGVDVSCPPPAECKITGSGSCADVLSACKTTPSPGLNYCAAWVTYVFANAGVGTYYGNACDMYCKWCYSSDVNELQPGMIIAVSSNPRGGYAGTVYGHVGIYIGNGKVMENIGYIAITPLDEWLDWYSSVVTPRWGWIGGVELS